MYQKTELIKRLKSFIEQNSLINSKKIGAAVSGGPDSIFMLYVLNEIKIDLGIDITILHFNHKIRKEADEDALFVYKLSKDMKLEYKTDASDVTLYARKEKLSLEDAARIKRYEFFKRCKKELHLGEIALAHTKNDLAETFIMNMLRGAALSGLTSMRPRRDFYIRPVLFLGKDEILSYLKEEKIEFRIDKTNKDANFTRNRIRLELIDTLKNYNPNIVDTIYRQVDILTQEGRYMENVALRESVKYVKFEAHKAVIDIAKIGNKAIKRRVISIVCKRLMNTHYSLSFKNIDRIASLKDDKKVVVLRKLIKAYIKDSKLIIEPL